MPNRFSPAGRTGRTGCAGTAALVVLVAVMAVLAAGSAWAQAGKTIKTEGEFLGFDASAKTVTVKVTDPGGEDLRRGQEAVFKVKPTGSVLSKTTVAIQGRKAELDQIPVGKTVNVYWREDDAEKGARFARKIDVVMTLEEFEQRYGAE